MMLNPARLLLFSIVVIISCQDPYPPDFSVDGLEEPVVKFLNTNPIIDGQLDSDLEYLQPHQFNYIWQFDNPITDTVQVTYRIAYTPSHLYVYLETDADSITYHRRGYLWGDGYKVLLGIPQSDSLTNEYCEVYFSPTIEEEYEWGRQGVNQKYGELSSKTTSQEKAHRNRSGFETLIAWDDIKPYHPWFMKDMGYNIYFAKGIDDKKHAQHGWITNGYSLVDDDGIWDEELQKRKYVPISFEDPSVVNEQVILAKPKKKNLSPGEQLIIETSSVGTEVTQGKLTVTISDMNSKLVVSKKIDVQFNDKLKREEFSINIDNLESGRYDLIVQSLNDTIAHDVLVIWPTTDFQKITEELQRNVNELEIGAINTLHFEINQITSKLAEVKKYETGGDLLEDWESLLKKYELYDEGIDPYKNVTEPYRRGFKSKYDSTFQPYTIKLPKNYDPSKKYPLLVFLHGSGSDEQEQKLLDRPRSGGNFIEIAPLGRDIYRAYAEDDSQKDIIEAIDDVSKYFSVDKDKIIIGGFSMGGYGALRTFYEHPELYKGVVVHAGHPNLANEWLDGEHPNFLDEKYLTSFTNMPVFIYHGRKDAACDVGLIESLSEKLTEAGAIVIKSIVEENGHEYPDDRTNRLYFDWLDKVIKE